MKKLWFIPPRVLTTDILLQEFDATHELIYQIDDKYHRNRYIGKSLGLNRFFRYQPYVYLRNKMVNAEILKRTGSSLYVIPQSIIKFGDVYYNPTNKSIQEQCTQVFDYWDDMQNTEMVSELSVLTTLQIQEELQFMFEMYKEKYGL